ncbi:MAG: T9SS type A sorting domain-containing protein [Candidatus Krumholzibacteriota bacterium]|nr:T9SS type A sorting domain-containing protein [Candidatus Krumholzibacteriota bacterium]
MKHRTGRALAVLAVAAAIMAPIDLSAVPVTFQVRMSYQAELGRFDPESDFVDVAGSFNGWGTDPLTPLHDADGDTVYAVTLDGFSPDEQIEFKFRIDGQWDGTEEFPGVGNNRSYTVLESGNIVDVWYDDLEPGANSGELYWWNDRVFYEIFVRSFSDDDGDGIGDFTGLTRKLDYLNDGDPATTDDLGITGIWLMPIHDSPSYHGYDAVDYRSIHPDYGTMADFQTFLDAAHARGIKVIIDFVMNHCSNAHPWFQASAAGDPSYRDWFRWSQNDPGQTGPWGQQVWHWNASGWFYGLFWSGMPDLDYETQAVKDEMFDTAAWWLDSVGVDGFRLDAVLYIREEGDQLQNTPATFAFWEDYTAHVKAVAPGVLSVGEAWTSTSTVLQYVTNDRLDFCFEFDLAYAILGAAAGGDAEWLESKAGQVYDLYPFLQYGTFLTNHDQDRVMNALGFDEGKARLAAGIYLTQPGIPFVYYGEEIGMVGSGAHEYIRTPMQWTDGANAGFTSGTPWQAVNGNYEQYNVQTEEQDPGSLLEWYKLLIGARNGSAALRRGAYWPLAASASPVLAFVRTYAGETVLCMANTADHALASITLTGSAATLEPGEMRLANLLVSGDTLDVAVGSAYEIAGISLDAYEVAVYRFAGEVTGVETGGGLPPCAGPRLGRNYPNPFNPSTTITFELPRDARVDLSIYDVRGGHVRTVAGGLLAAGHREARWDGRDEAGNAVNSGVYFCRLTACDRTLTRKLVLLR